MIEKRVRGEEPVVCSLRVENLRELLEDGDQFEEPLTRVGTWRGLPLQPPANGARVGIERASELGLVKLSLGRSTAETIRYVRHGPPLSSALSGSLSAGMNTLPSPLDRLAGGLAYLPRIGTYDGRAIEEALKGATLYDHGVSLRGAIVDAHYATGDPELLQRLRATFVPFLVDLQTLRFTRPGFRDVAKLRELPYAPPAPFEPLTFESLDADRLVTKALALTQELHACAHTVPGLPLHDQDLELWVRANRLIVERACRVHGTGDIERRGLVALVAPGRRAMKSPELVLEWLVDLPVDAVYVQPLNLHPVRDGFEKLANYVAYLRSFKEAGLGVIAGRVGAFGLVLQALGISCFDSGLGDGEAFSFSSHTRPPTKRRKGTSGGGRDRRIYLEPLKTTLQARHAQLLLQELGLRARFACELGCCRHRGFEDLPDRRRVHYLFTRDAEVAALRDKPDALRLEVVHQQLLGAREHARAVRRAFFAKQITPPSFEHLDRWIGLLARQDELREAA
jgi:hypothetical protein